MKQQKVVIEKTGKFWKLLTALAVLAIGVGIGLKAGGYAQGDVLLICGIPGLLFARLGAWWSHG